MAQRARHERHRALPHGGAGRPRRAVRRLRPPAHRLQQLPQPALPEVPVADARAVARGSARRAAAGRILPRRLHRAAGDRRHRLPEQGAWSTTCCSAPPPRRCARSPPTPSTWVPRSASSRSCTPGARTCCITRICTAWCPAVASRPDGQRWVACRPGFFLPVRVLSRLFRRLFLAQLRAGLRRAARCSFFNALAALQDAGAFARYLAPVARAEWVVYAKPPFGGPEQVLEYLGPLHASGGDRQQPARRVRRRPGRASAGRTTATSRATR